ncbi:hypothetical protein CXF72_14890 [Psychromonas sp. MB-3u-54]|nr:hypothetical protein CXF72_14890 [Psychromonas sp. MB-3u-54]
MPESLKAESAGCQKAMPAHTPGTVPLGSAIVGYCFCLLEGSLLKRERKFNQIVILFTFIN